MLLGNITIKQKGYARRRGLSLWAELMQDFAEKLYKSKAWQKCRKAYISSVGGLCERCLARGCFTPGEIVHHRIHLTPSNVSDPDITLNFSNLELLCRDCHGKEHGKTEKRFKVDELGRVSAI